MQSGYGTAEIHPQQFMADDPCPSPFSLSNPHKQNHHLLHYNHQYQHPQQHHISLTHQLLQHPNHFQAFQQQQQQRVHHALCLGREAAMETVGGDCGTPTLPFFNMNFKLGLNENESNGDGVSNDDEEDEDGLLRGNERHIPEGRPNSLIMSHCWQPQEDSAIKEPLWKPRSPFNENKCAKFSEQVNGNHHCKRALEEKYRHYGELEAIYGAARIGETNQTGSGSALTAENSPTNASLPMQFRQSVTAAGASTAAIGVYHGSETSFGEEASVRKTQKRKRKRKMRDKLGSMAGFFERLEKQLMDHQEGLQRKFLGVIGKMDQERIKREEEWRCQEAAKYNREAIARAHEQALASCREAAIVSYLEKMTGQSINLPLRKTQLYFQSEIQEEPIKEMRQINIENNGRNTSTNNRWPKDEVEALIQVRSSLESKFQEPGLKGPLWEEISASMATMGYIRSAKRCKEKWENINKYFRKTKESVKKRSQLSKTCPYFEQLDQLYSRSLIIPSSSSNSPSYCSRPSVVNDVGVQMRGNSELLEAIIIGNDLGIAPNPSIEKFKIVEMGRLKLDLDGIVDEELELRQRSHGGDDMDEGEDLEDNEEEEDGGGEEEY